ncbi:GatB/YqeY domain-containing protein [Candidatus Fermentibacteria bacterium]|nr:GatB/YqeY domain-containing protein [Candidatus Fermentibacteria bacterium]
MLSERLAEDLKGAMKAKDDVALRTARMLRTELRYREDEVRRPLKPEDEVAVVRTAIQRRRDAAGQFRAAGRVDLAVNEEAEAEFLNRYMPEQLDETAVEALITTVLAETHAAGPRDFGRLMKVLMERVAGRADGGTVSRLLRQRLQAMA